MNGQGEKIMKAVILVLLIRFSLMGKHDKYGGSLANSAFDSYCPVVEFHQGLDQRQAKACTFKFAA